MTYNELIILIPSHSLEDFPTELGDEAAASVLNAFAVVWHPQLLATAGVLPKWQRADEASEVKPNRLIIVPKPSEDLVPAAWVERARREGSQVVTGICDRQQLLSAVLEPLSVAGSLPLDADLVADFYALGTVHLMTELLTRHMRNFSHLDEVHMEREAVAAARSALAQDQETAEKHLRHCFEMLLECRERFYPVDCFLIDLCLVLPRLADEPLSKLLTEPAAVNLLAPVQDWETIIQEHPEHLEAIQTHWRTGQIDLLGGEWQESPSALIALDSVIWQLRRGRTGLARLFGRAPTVWGRKRFGVHAQMPQLLKRFGYSAGLHFVMDDGVYPDDEQSKLKWEGVDGNILETFSRIPLAGDSASAFLRLPACIANSMDHDHTAAVSFARWPQLRTPWLNDLRRAFRYAPVLGKFTTFDEFFRYSDAPGRSNDCKASGYFSPFLLHSVARQEPDPISRYLNYWEQRRVFERASWSMAIGALLHRPHLPGDTCESLEAAVEQAHPDADAASQETARSALQIADEQIRSTLTSRLCMHGMDGSGLLVVNPLSFPRTLPITWPADQEPLPSSIVQHVQVNEDRAAAMVKVPPCGFVWLSSPPRSPKSSPLSKPAMAEGLVLRNDFFEVHLSDVTGGIGQIRTYKRSPNRLSQQLAYRFPHERTITIPGDGPTQSYKSYYSEMVMSESKVLSAGPALGEIETSGGIVDQHSRQLLAGFRQHMRVWRERPVVEVDLELTPQKLPEGDPWTNYYCLRFAWKEPAVSLTASQQQGAHAVKGPRMEAPQFVELAEGRHRTTILTPGLPFHRKTGDRMLDTLLVVEGETRRKFNFAIAIDHDFPMEALLDVYSLPLVIPTATAPRGPSGGWLFQVSVRNVQLTRILPLETIEHDPPCHRQGYVLRLLETEGRRHQFELRCFLPPTSARQCDFQGKTVNTLKISGDTVIVDIAPYEICDVELLYAAT